MNLQGWANGAWADGSWVETSWGTPQVAEVADSRGRSGKPRRKYRLIGDIEQLEKKLRQEEAQVEKVKKKVKLLIKKQSSPVGIYKDFEPQIARMERVIDRGMERIEELNYLIQLGMQANDDEEEEMLLLSL